MIRMRFEDALRWFVVIVGDRIGVLQSIKKAVQESRTAKLDISIYFIVIANEASGRPSEVAVIFTLPALFLAPTIASAKPLNALR